MYGEKHHRVGHLATETFWKFRRRIEVNDVVLSIKKPKKKKKKGGRRERGMERKGRGKRKQMKEWRRRRSKKGSRSSSLQVPGQMKAIVIKHIFSLYSELPEFIK